MQPGRGRTPDVPLPIIERLAARLARMNMLTPNKLRRRVYRACTRRCKLYSRGAMCKILRALGYSPKTSVTTYRSAAKKRTVTVWQSKAKIVISEAKNDGFQIVIQDESIFLRVGANGKKLWTLINEPVVVKRAGRRDRTVVYGALADDGTRLVRQYERFDAPTFVRYLEEARRKWGKVLHNGQRQTAYGQACERIP